MKILKVLLIIILTSGALYWLLFKFFGIQALFTDKVVNESLPPIVAKQSSSSSMPASEDKILYKSTFQTGDSTYNIKGKVSVFERPKFTGIALEDFEVTNGPDLYIYLIKVDGVIDNASVKEAVKNGHFKKISALKGNIGSQVYEVSGSISVSDFNVVSIWCERFSRNFGFARLDLPSGF